MNELDLHGIRHDQVISLLDYFIWENMKLDSGAVKIITGNSIMMKEIVHDIADEYGLKVEEAFNSNASLIVILK